jgi:nucleoside-diphosphate-sugar epimerase
MQELNNTAILVTGGAGFIGSAIVRQLLSDGAKVVCFDNYLFGRPDYVAGLSGDLEIVHGDILDTWKLNLIIKAYAINYIIHCAGDTYVPSSYEMPKRFFEINVFGTYNVLMAARTNNIKRVLYLSSTEVYGKCTADKIAENAPLEPVNTYAVSKLAADQLCVTMHVEHRIPVVIARIFNSFGPRETHPYVIPEIITQLNRSNVLCLGNIKAERDLTYVNDTARAIIAILRSDISDGDIVNIGSGKPYSIEWLAYAIAEIMGVSISEIVQDPNRIRRNDIDRFCCDNSKLRFYTDWQPRIPIKEGLRKTVDWFYSNGFEWSWEHSAQDVRQSEYLIEKIFPKRLA